MTRVRDGDVEDPVELVGERCHNEGRSAGPGTEEISTGRLLIGMLVEGETRALEEVENRYGNRSITVARSACRLEVGAPLLGMLREIVRAIALHERKLESPARLPDDRKPDELLLREESDECDAAMEGSEHYDDVDPRNMVCKHQIVAVASETVHSFDVPTGREQEVRDRVVHRNPPFTKGSEGQDEPTAEMEIG